MARTRFRSGVTRQSQDGISRMRRRMVLEAPSLTPDGAGGADIAFTSVATVWAGLEWLGGEERWREGGFAQAGRWRITLRWREGVTAGHRLRDGTRRFDIRSAADPDGGGRRLVCLCEEIS